jgi:lipopolysaccharide transport system permease protein
VYFPRLVVPIAAVLSGIVDFVLAFIVLLAMMAYYHIAPTVNVVFLPLFLLLALVAALSVGIWLSALNVEYRDVRYVVPFLVQIWLFATPIAYAATLLHGRARVLYALNPMVGVVEGFRWALLGTQVNIGLSVVLSAVVSVLLLLSGALYFRRMEKTFADVV